MVHPLQLLSNSRGAPKVREHAIHQVTSRAHLADNSALKKSLHQICGQLDLQLTNTYSIHGKTFYYGQDCGIGASSSGAVSVASVTALAIAFAAFIF